MHHLVLKGVQETSTHKTDHARTPSLHLTWSARWFVSRNHLASCHWKLFGKGLAFSKKKFLAARWLDEPSVYRNHFSLSSHPKPVILNWWVTTHFWVADPFSVGRVPLPGQKNKKIKKNNPVLLFWRGFFMQRSAVYSHSLTVGGDNAF